ncbi:TlpA disulfide reductase family protein [Pelagicoccus sp. SDUM812002]|uniref:peroxiredoxin family protein n=1 Tax=Pelagicoccus sp. SDUM812002 TaxID=3041266 RepID=UPI00280CD8CA|nr:TlpA disulfide reductase family protein [Pelagicoccus sp. SDUM812002]MDQ8185656.1 TlpA disulfide reductase family protein [Pelagicoccus sp. SDUM812002]
MKLFIALGLGVAAFPFSASAAFTLTAEPGALPASVTVSLSRHDIDQRSTIRITTATTEADGSFRFESDEEAGIFVLKLEDTSDFTLAIAENEKIKLSLSEGSLSTIGSPGTKILQAYETFRKESLARLVYPTRTDIKDAKARNATDDEIVQLTQAEVDAYQAHLEELNDFVIAEAGDTMALYGSSLRLSGDYRLDELAEQVKSFSARHGDIGATRSLQRRIKTARDVALGNTAPELEGNNLKGETVRLSDFRGRYILVDFWASWCPPCRLENQHYAKLVDRIDASSFDIFAVNLDTSKRVWSQSVSRDRADWIHISDLEGWTSPLAATYGVGALPASFLIDPQGRIVAKNLRGEALDAKLQELGLLTEE